MSKSHRGYLGFVLVGLCGVMATGCANYSKHPGHSAVANDLTPDLMTLTKRPIDVNNSRTLTYNENWRMMWEDLSRASMLDRPSHLSRAPLAR